jgi:hypothetical protein
LTSAQFFVRVGLLFSGNLIKPFNKLLALRGALRCVKPALAVPRIVESERIGNDGTTRSSKGSAEKMTEYIIFLSACMGLTLSLIGLWLWIERWSQWIVRWRPSR